MKFQVGEDVRIKQLHRYHPSKDQGLLVGNTGTVMEIEEGIYYVKMENAVDTAYLGPGWAFFEDELEAISVPDVVVVHWQAAQVAAQALDDWQEMFDAIPGLEKFERYSYGPAVEQARNELIAAAPSAKGVV